MEVFLNLAYHPVALRPADQTDRDSHASKTSGSADAVKVDFRISTSAIVIWKILAFSQHQALHLRVWFGKIHSTVVLADPTF